MKQDYICAGALTEEALTGAVSDFLYRVRPHRERLWDYYEGQQPVPKGEAVRGRPNNLLRVPFPRYITEVQTGYFLGVPPTLSYERPEEGRIYAGLPMDHLLFDIGRDMSICGEGFALVWLEQSGVRVCRCDPSPASASAAARPVSRSAPPSRLFKRPDDTVCGMLYEEERVTPFTWDGQRAALGAPEENLPGHLALVPFNNNCQTCGDFEMVTGLLDAYNLLLSGAMDDMQSVANAFLALYGMQGTTQGDIDEANRTRILSLAEGGPCGIRSEESEPRGPCPAGEQSAPQYSGTEHDAGSLRRALRRKRLRRGDAVQAVGHRAGAALPRSAASGRSAPAADGAFRRLCPAGDAGGAGTGAGHVLQESTAGSHGAGEHAAVPLSPAVQAHHSGTAAVGEGRGGGTGGAKPRKPWRRRSNV